MPDRSLHKLLAILLLLLFSIGSVPRVYFHEVFVHHRDIGECQYPNKKLAHIHSQGYSCQIHQLVVDSPFTQPFIFSKLEQPQPIQPAYSSVHTNRCLTYSAHFESRGPPVLILCA